MLSREQEERQRRLAELRSQVDQKRKNIDRLAEQTEKLERLRHDILRD